ncbi:hypothetical protein TNCT_43941, partial [Trichonephila clavata]
MKPGFTTSSPQHAMETSPGPKYAKLS